MSPAASRSRIRSSEPRLLMTPKPAWLKRRVMSASSQRGLKARRTKWNRPRYAGYLARPAIVETSQLPKCPVRMSTPLPWRSRGDECLVVLDSHQRRLALGRHEAVVDEFAEELQQMAVVRLREPLDLLLRDGFAVHAA